MHKHRYLLYVTFVVITLLSCHTNPQGSTTPSGGTGAEKKKSFGRIEFREELHNFGTVKEGEIIAFSFSFRNLGDDPVRLNKVEPGCGCLTVKYDPEMVKSGESSVLEVIFNTAGEWGNQVKTVDIETTSGQVVQLTVGAFVENKNFNFDLNK